MIEGEINVKVMVLMIRESCESRDLVIHDRDILRILEFFALF